MTHLMTESSAGKSQRVRHFVTAATCRVGVLVMSVVFLSAAHAGELSKGAIDAKYQKLGGEKSALSKPTGEEAARDDGGAYRVYEKGYIFWSAKTGAHFIQPDLERKWAALDFEKGNLGYPVSDETTKGDGRYIHFQGGSIYYTPQTGAFELHGPIRDKWTAQGSTVGELGYPVSDTRITPDGIGRYAHFQNGSIYWSPWSGAHEIHGTIRERWFALGREQGYLGYPTSDERDFEGGRRTDFQNGYIVWTKANGAKDFSNNTEPLELLKDKDVCELAVTLFRRDHGLDRSDVLEIFRQVEKDGHVSEQQLKDLKTLVAYGRILAMPDYVRLLASKVVFGDPANGHYQGGELGNLEAGNESSKLESLVKKWFLGMDHPATGKSGVTYQLVEGSLFGKGVNYRDVEQGTAGDCYYLASLAEIALRNPNVIRQMFVDNGDDTYTVLFQHDGGFDCVTVDRYLPIDAKKHFLFADVKHDPKDPNLKLWVPLAEKAYAQLAESGWLHAKAENSYIAVGSSGNPGWASQVISGGNAMIRQSLDFDAVVKAYQAGSELTFTSKPTKADTEKNKVVVKHCYAVMSVDIKERTVTLFNPWGVQSRPEYPGELTLSWSQVQESFNNWNSVAR